MSFARPTASELRPDLMLRQPATQEIERAVS